MDVTGGAVDKGGGNNRLIAAQLTENVKSFTTLLFHIEEPNV